ncbi:hypothetical protein Tco_0579175 [Tanacetum coccineum]
MYNKKDDLIVAQMLYPWMQCADVFFLKEVIDVEFDGDGGLFSSDVHVMVYDLRSSTPIRVKDYMLFLTYDNNKSREKCDVLLRRIEEVLRAIADAEESKEVFEAIKSGTEATKDKMITIEKWINGRFGRVGQHVRPGWGDPERLLAIISTPKNVDMADDEFILHVEGTATSQRVIRHIGKQSWPGNNSVYFDSDNSVYFNGGPSEYAYLAASSVLQSTFELVDLDGVVELTGPADPKTVGCLLFNSRSQ